MDIDYKKQERKRRNRAILIAGLLAMLFTGSCASVYHIDRTDNIVTYYTTDGACAGYGSDARASLILFGTVAILSLLAMLGAVAYAVR